MFYVIKVEDLGKSYRDVHVDCFISQENAINRIESERKSNNYIAVFLATPHRSEDWAQSLQEYSIADDSKLIK